jgi:hypothetical protein
MCQVGCRPEAVDLRVPSSQALVNLNETIVVCSQVWGEQSLTNGHPRLKQVLAMLLPSLPSQPGRFAGGLGPCGGQIQKRPLRGLWAISGVP